MGDNANAIDYPQEGFLSRAPGTYAVFDTSQGKIVIYLFEDKAPKTVANFVGLAEGTKEFKDPKTGQKAKRPFYDGLVFHRVIPQFMVQGGCPLGSGTGDPGYRFEDEFHKDLKHCEKKVSISRHLPIPQHPPPRPNSTMQVSDSTSSLCSPPTPSNA